MGGGGGELLEQLRNSEKAFEAPESVLGFFSLPVLGGRAFSSEEYRNEKREFFLWGGGGGRLFNLFKNNLFIFIFCYFTFIFYSWSLEVTRDHSWSFVVTRM